LLDSKVYTFFFAAHASHFIQPLDDKMFTNFKKILAAKTRKLTEHNARQSTTASNTILTVSASAEKEAFTKSVIVASFADTGIWPFDKDLILTRAKLATTPIAEMTSSDALPIEEKAKLVTLKLLEEKPPTTDVKKVKVKIKKNTVYSADQLLEQHEETQLKKEKLQKEKESKQEMKEESKKKKLEELQQKEMVKRQKAEKKGSRGTREATSTTSQYMQGM
jgi:hypothetical protein